MKTLYKINKNGSIQQWSVKTNGATIICTFGQVGGKMQTKSTVAEPKNVGRANETTAEQQAILEAESKYAKQIKSGYVTDPSGQSSIQLPQKVKSYQDNKHALTLPARSTPKLNGVNATYWLIDDELKLTSRGGEEYPAIPHLEDDIRMLMQIFDTTCLNGELYIHGEHLQDIQSAVKKPKELSKKLTFNLFELPLLATTYANKVFIMENALIEHSNFFESTDYVALLTGVVVHTPDQIEKHWEMCVNKFNLEGTVIYNLDAEYKFGVRSSNVFKYKKSLDGEYKIVDMEVDKNGHPVFHCITPESKVFKVKPKGTDAERKQIVVNFESEYKNNWYKIEYETLSKDLKPLKPIGVCLRDCDSNGNPKE